MNQLTSYELVSSALINVENLKKLRPDLKGNPMIAIIQDQLETALEKIEEEDERGYQDC